MKSNCKAIIQDGPRKGQSCIQTTKVDADGYCARHQRQKEYNSFLAQGKRVCRMFFRGCNSILKEYELTCASCLSTNRGETTQCLHNNTNGKQCPNKILHSTTKYCGKHHRDEYYDDEKERRIKYCNVERGCMNICDTGYQSCKSCIINNYIVNDRYFDRSIDNKNICIMCEEKYESNTLSDAIKQCSECINLFLVSQCDKKEIQKRLYANTNLHNHYNRYIRGACIRNREFELTMPEFEEIIKQPCYYCKTHNNYDAMGVDRVDNTKNYIIDNVVPCCTTCNRMKHTNSIEEFINKCYAIHTFLTSNVSITEKLMKIFPNFKSISHYYYSDYIKRNASNRQFEFTLSSKEFNEIRSKACYLCGVESLDDHFNGINESLYISYPIYL